MAKENIEISDKVKKCKILLLDIEGTTTSISFVKDNLFPYAEENVKVFLDSHWEEEGVKEAVAALRKQAAEDQEKSVEGAVIIPGEDAVKDEQIEGLVKNVKWQMAADRKAGPLKQLQGLIWKQGYDNGDIKGHVYDDVSPALELWRSVEGQKVYIYSSGSVQAQKLLFAKSSAGDMLPLIDGHFDTAVGAKQEASSYAAIAEKIGAKPEEILFLTDIVKEAEAAVASGVQAALLSREGNAPLPAEAAASFPVLHSFDQLASTNKRKPEPQVEEVPAKIPKTDIQDDVKTASETEVEAVKTNGNTVTAEDMEILTEKTDEKMEVEEKMDVEESLSEDSAVTANVDENIAEKDVPMAEAVETVPSVSETQVTVTAYAETAVTDKVTPPVTEASIPSVDNTNVEKPVEESVVPAQAAETKAEEKPAAAVETLPVEAVPEKIATESKAADNITVEQSVAESITVDGPTTDTKTETPVETVDTVTSIAEATVGVSMSVNAPAASTEEICTTEANTIDGTESEKVDVPSVEPKETVAGTKTKDNLKVDSTAETVPIEEAESKAVEDISIANNEDVDSVTNAEITKASKVDIPENDISEADAIVEEPITNAPESVTPPVTSEAVIEDVTNKDVDTPVRESEPIVEENGEKTESIETDEMETDDTDLKNLETVIEPKEEAEKAEESAPVPTNNMPTIITEVQDITDDKQSLSEVTDVIDDLVPIVEEPSPLEEMEELQNAGDVLQDAADVLEKECDEILSKVHNVTSLDYIPIKPLHTIAEEMETENIDSNDIVERILDTEMELSMKPCEDIDINTVQEIAEPKPDEAKLIETATENPTEVPNVAEASAGVKMDEDVSSSTEISENKETKHKEESGGNNEAKADLAEEKMEVAEDADPEPKVESEVNNKPEESKTEADIPTTDPAPQAEETVAKPENKEPSENTIATQNETKDATSQDAKKDTNATETKVNGNATNGDATVKLNGDANKDELQSRLTVENGKEKVNGANGDSAEGESGQGDIKIETEIPDIKVKTVDEPRAKPTEQPVEA